MTPLETIRAPQAPPNGHRAAERPPHAHEPIRAETSPGGVCLVAFDRPGSSANLLDSATLDAFSRHLDRIEKDKAIHGVIFHSAKPSIFIAGADLREFGMANLPEEEIRRLLELGQGVFNRVAALDAVTIAAIHGACVGGGFELALACDHRVASDDPSTRIGLPETSIGLLPGWGGSTRLPRLIGLPKALDVILRGRRLAARHALKFGMIDEVAPRELLLDIARKRLARGKPRRKRHLFLNSPIAAVIAALTQKPKILAATRGNYPAISRALDVVTRGICLPHRASLALEAAAVSELARTDACRNLVRLFFISERARKPASHRPAATHDVQSAAVIGAGVMGAGIAQWLSAKGLRILLVDVDPARAAAGQDAVARLYDGAVKRHVMTPIEARRGLDRVVPCHEYVPLAHVDLVIEVAGEQLQLKQRIFQQLGRSAGPRTILATNTSALPVGELACAAGRPDRVAGLHFFNPVHAMPLVEVISPDGADPAVIEACLKFVRRIGKLPVLVRDTPGFLVNRILMPYLVEAVRLFAECALTREIDEAMLDFGMPMGPLRLIDEVGVDVAADVAAHLAGELGNRFPLPPLLDAMRKAGHLGRKVGIGFYAYHEHPGRPDPNPDIFQWLPLERVREIDRDALQERMVLPLVNEAARCLQEHVVADADDVDFAMVQGTGFAPFRGGPLRYADAVGPSKIAAALSDLAAKHGARFAPCGLLDSLAKSGGSFHQKAET